MAGNSFVGRLPVILNCKHTICQECVHKMYSSREIICGECHTSNFITDIEAKKKADQLFPVNQYVYGALSYHKRFGCDNSNVNFKPAGYQFKQPRHQPAQEHKPNSFLSFGMSPTQQPQNNPWAFAFKTEEPQQGRDLSSYYCNLYISAYIKRVVV